MSDCDLVNVEPESARGDANLAEALREAVHKVNLFACCPGDEFFEQMKALRELTERIAAALATREPQPLDGVPVTEYEILYPQNDPYHRVVIRKVPGPYGWGIFRGSNSLSRESCGGYYLFTQEWLSSSSERDPSFYDNHRFQTAQAAYDFWITNRSRIVATAQEHRAFVESRRKQAKGREQRMTA